MSRKGRLEDEISKALMKFEKENSGDKGRVQHPKGVRWSAVGLRARRTAG